MNEPEYVIVLRDKREYVTISEAALLLGLNRRRIFQFLERGELSSKLVPRSTIKIIPLDEVRAFAKKKRPTGRPPKKKSAKKGK